MKLSRTPRTFLIGACVGVGALVATSPHASAELRKFAVMLAHSPKSQLDANGRPGLPVGGLHSVEDIRKRYFDRSDPNLDSFAEYWEEISYGDVTITGDVLEWVTLPWALDPNAPNGGTRASAENYIDLHANQMEFCTSGVNPPVPAPFAYGAGEDFCDCFSSEDPLATPVTTADCGALIIIDRTGTDGDNLQGNDPPVRGPGLDDRPVAGVAVWTPGERFIDLDDDNRWDGVDEVNDQLCPGPNGCQVPLCSRSRVECKMDGDCPGVLSGEVCTTADRPGGGPRGCNTRGCGDLAMPWIDWDGSDDADAINNCAVPAWLNSSGTQLSAVSPTTHLLHCGDPLQPGHCQATGSDCQVDADCDTGDFCQLFNDSVCPTIQGYAGQACPAGFCPPTNCRLPDATGNLPQLLPCCDTPELDPNAPCTTGVAGLTCQNDADTLPLPQCCEFVDSTDSGGISVAEPFEDFMVRWNPKASSFQNAWIRVTDKYVRDNYPGDVDALIARTGNGFYDPPDLFVDRGNTKMMQDANLNQFGWVTPEPGTFYTSGPPNFEATWFQTFWLSRYFTTPPPWPGGIGGFIAPNSPVMRPFDPDAPVPPIIQNTETTTIRRWFQANAGGWNGQGRGTKGDVSDHNTTFDLGSDDWSDLGRILPEEEFGYYDGWVEHDDLASSKYHHAGDKRLGEVTSPTTDTVTYPGGTGETYTAIAGVDLGPNTPFGLATRDSRTVAAGPLAINIHGEKGFDAGDVCILEWLTWRTDGTSPTVSAGWEAENGDYHPFAGPSSPRNGGPKGFADYNLDGMIDQGEVRPELSESYSVDSDPFTANDGSDTNYPFNRRRLVEDVVEALDLNVDWDDFVDPNRGNTVSGIVLVPGDSYSDINRFPFNPRFFPIHTEDTAFNPLFHDLVICQTCRDFPADIAYASHEYLHTWEGYPDLYDYDVFDEGGVINCPIGIWDIMERTGVGLVHPTPPLKEELSGWVESVDLATILTPGVVTTITLPPAEKVRDESYFFLANSERPSEREYFWSAGSGMDEGRFPGKGMLILHTQDFLAINNSEGITSQQRTTPANFRIVQADGLGELEACSSSGDTGDFGDMWPGSSNATTYNFNTTPSARWTSQNRWTGIDISDVRPDNFGSVSLTLSLTPTNIPSLKFINPPGGETVGNIFQVRFETTDVFGGTTIKLYYTTNPLDLSTSAANFIGSQVKGAPGTIRSSINWNIGGLADGRYSIFAKLVPGLGADGTERAATAARASRNNVGDGQLSVSVVDISSSDTAKARSETWVATCIDPAGTEWVVYSSLTQPEPENPIPGPFPHAFTDASYTSIGGEVTFQITAGPVPFTEGDSFNFTTTGLTAPSAAVEILEGKISLGPHAVIVANPLTIRPGEVVSFDASESSDPQNQTLTYAWDFGDGSPTSSGETTTHIYRESGTFTVTLKATNTDRLFDEASVDIVVFNNSPNAVVTASPTSGSAPLTVNLSGSGSSDTESDSANLIFQWDFGDGTTINDQGDPGTFQSVPHVFEKDRNGTLCTPTVPCTFTVRLTVTDEGGKADFAEVVILVGNSDPIAVVTATPDSGDSPLTVEFDASGSHDPDGQSLTVTWDFDDDSPTETGLTRPHVYKHNESSAQQYHPTATIEDGFGGVATWTTPIDVAPEPEPNDPPVAAFAVTPGSLTGLPGDIFTFDAGTTTDAQQTKESLLYKWAFGDGLFGTGISVTHSFSDIGDFQVELTVTDDRGETSIITKTISINPPTNRPPTAIIATGPRAGTAPALLTFDGRNSFDLDGGQTLTFSWAFKTESGELLETIPGSVASRTFRDPGIFKVVLTVDDGNGGVDSSPEITVTILAAPTDSIVGGGGDPQTGQPIPDSASQRPSGRAFCGMGMLTSLFGSLVGLSLMVVGRGRRRNRR